MDSVTLERGRSAEKRPDNRRTTAWSFWGLRVTEPALALAILALACGKDKDAGEAHAKPTVSVRTAIARSQAITETLGAIGTVTARPGRIAALPAPGPSR